MEQMPIPPIVPISNCQILINRRKKAKRNAIIMAIVCFAITIGMIWWIHPDIWLDAHDKLNAVRPIKSRILNEVGDRIGSNEWKLIGWGEPVSTGNLQIEYETQRHYESADGTIKFYGNLKDTWNDCAPGGTMYPLEIEAHTPAFGWRPYRLGAIIRDGKVKILYSDCVRMREDENGKRRHIIYR